MVRKPKGRGLYQKTKEQQEECLSIGVNWLANRTTRIDLFFWKPRMNANRRQFQIGKANR